jgi:hypothetical protein
VKLRAARLGRCREGGSSPDNAGTCQHRQMGGSGKRDEEEYARNRRDYVPRKVNRLKPGGYGPGAVRTRAGGSGAGNFRTVMWVAVREATVTCCGVVVAMPQG